jgi:hypothetical protein
LADSVAKVADRLVTRKNGIRTIRFLNQYCALATDLESMLPRYEAQTVLQQYRPTASFEATKRRMSNLGNSRQITEFTQR